MLLLSERQNRIGAKNRISTMLQVMFRDRCGFKVSLKITVRMFNLLFEGIKRLQIDKSLVVILNNQGTKTKSNNLQENFKLEILVKALSLLTPQLQIQFKEIDFLNLDLLQRQE